jgi:hypothetical protein
MYLYSMESQKHNHNSKRIMIFQNELDFNYETLYFVFTEIEDGVPLRTYYYKIPESYKDSRLLGQLHERYYPYCPN